MRSRLALPLSVFEAVVGRLAALQAHSSLCPYELFARHPQIAQAKQREQLRGVLGKALVAHLCEAELALDDSQGVFQLGAHTDIEFLSLFAQCAPRSVVV